ncbi:unnamed protein product [Prunus armeniaca]
MASKQRLAASCCLCRVDMEKRRAEKERAEKGHVPSGYFLPLTFKVLVGLPNPLNMKLHCNQWYSN